MKEWFEQLVDAESSEVKLCVEMSGNHQGSLAKALEFIEAIPNDKLIAVKFQVYTPDTITIDCDKPDFEIPEGDNWSAYPNYHALYEAAHTPWAWIERLAKKCIEKSIPWFASPFDISAVQFLEKLNCQAYKIASPEITDLQLIKAVSETHKPIIISTGLAQWSDVDLALASLDKNSRGKLALLKCTSSYPAGLEDLNLSALRTLKQRYRCAIGFSDHTRGTPAAIAAVTLGATIIEKHFKLDDDTQSVDHHFSTPLSEALDFVNLLNQVKRSMGYDDCLISKSALPSLNGRRSIYYAENLKKGQAIHPKMIKSVRPGHGLHPQHLPKIINQILIKDVEKGDRVSLCDIGLKDE